MSKNKIISLILAGIVIVAVSFYLGMQYGQNSKSQMGPGGNFSQRNGQMGSSTLRGNRSLGGMVSGQILSIDTNSLTIKSQDGGSRIVFLSASTTVSKMTEGALKDLIVGSNVSVNGGANADNSINAQTIQIRPLIPNR